MTFFRAGPLALAARVGERSRLGRAAAGGAGGPGVAVAARGRVSRTQRYRQAKRTGVVLAAAKTVYRDGRSLDGSADPSDSETE